MTEFFFLIPISLILGALGLGVFLWTLRNGQYEDLDGAAERVLFEGNERPGPETPRDSRGR